MAATQRARPTGTPQTVRVPKAGEMVAAQLRRQVVTGELTEGASLPSETALMEQFGVSRPTLREAFRILESEQIIRIRRGAHGGAYVLVPDPAAAARYAGTLLQYRGTTLADVYEARARLESAGVGILANKRTAADLRRIDACLAEGQSLLSDPVAFAEQHLLAFPQLLMELAGNQTMAVLSEMLFAIVESHNTSYIRQHRDDADVDAGIRTTFRSHQKVAALIRDKQSEKATAHWRKHVNRISELMITDPTEAVLDVLS
ncbi:GntR family transcriptional regulator [Williamsia limnetica]|uniref:GntR family transcriptional regulator n=2 Tax=Williamsia TaxID=85043 RepID=A0A318RK51_WILLI|nr:MULTISPECIES: GntR family transcriptional regulator [Williamsia]MDV7136539.1 GntR family transcriptional regulator [Williamsia muralis]OZG28855.1 GntR family transcriptional regulator [Williamsia sp. 1138]PYE16937.1 GntR family transcriptional regulator [Williamsia limnetica]